MDIRHPRLAQNLAKLFFWLTGTNRCMGKGDDVELGIGLVLNGI